MALARDRTHPNSSAVSNLLSFEHPHYLDDYSMDNLIADHSSPSLLFGDFTSQEGPFSWLYLDSLPQEPPFLQKRPLLGEISNMPPLKKQCTPKTKTTIDPQTMAAKNRRERISERLKTLQELVPNGTKVDLVSMLEKAISYVKFLQLQVKVLATDEFWAAQGGKAPDISQVKEAIDAILSSQRDSTNSTSSSKS